MSDYFRKIGLSKIHTEYFGRFPVLEGLILQRYKSITNFCKIKNIANNCVNDYLRGRANPTYDFIKICLKDFDDYAFEDLFAESFEDLFAEGIENDKS